MPLPLDLFEEEGGGFEDAPLPSLDQPWPTGGALPAATASSFQPPSPPLSQQTYVPGARSSLVVDPFGRQLAVDYIDSFVSEAAKEEEEDEFGEFAFVEPAAAGPAPEMTLGDAARAAAEGTYEPPAASGVGTPPRPPTTEAETVLPEATAAAAAEVAAEVEAEAAAASDSRPPTEASAGEASADGAGAEEDSQPPAAAPSSPSASWCEGEAAPAAAAAGEEEGSGDPPAAMEPSAQQPRSPSAEEDEPAAAVPVAPAAPVLLAAAGGPGGGGVNAFLAPSMQPGWGSFPQAAGARVDEYGVAWTLLLEVSAPREMQWAAWPCPDQLHPETAASPHLFTHLQAAAARLQEGEALWREAQEAGCSDALEREAGGYLAALGATYYCAAVVRLAADALGLLGLLAELAAAWERCAVAFWGELGAPPYGAPPGSAPGADSLAAAALRASSCLAEVAGGTPPVGRVLAELEEGARRLGLMGGDEFPRLLEWREGLEAVTLLPLSVLPAAAAPWGDEGRPCLVPLANLWLRCVSATCPALD